MTLPELVVNSPTPGAAVALTTLNGAITNSATTLTATAAAPAGLQGAGQFRIIIDSEVMIVTAGASGTGWTITRGAEGSTAASHSSGASIYHYMTADALRALQSPDDLQNGVVLSGDGVVSSLAVSAAGVITGSMAAGTCWVTEPVSGALIRCAIPSGSFSLTPGSLPASGQFAIVGVDIVAATAGAAPLLAVSVKGTDQTTQALALSNSPATASGRVRLLDVVITNASGTYSLSTSRDRRPWARGAHYILRQTADVTGNVNAAHTPFGSPLQARMELTGAQTIVTWCGSIIGWSGTGYASLMYDGVSPDNVWSLGTAGGNVTAFALSDQYAPAAAGSHLIQCAYYQSSGASTVTSKGHTNGYAATLEIREVVSQNANNGTS